MAVCGACHCHSVHLYLQLSRQMDGRGPGRFEVAWECHGPKNVTSTTQLLK